jgi:ribonuclease HII
MPDFSLERAQAGRIAGVDEVGRGPLAGPVLAAAVILPRDAAEHVLSLLDDSKRLSPERRARALAGLYGLAGVEIALGAASVAEIERLNILGAAMLAMRRAVGRLSRPPDLALVDGNRAPGLVCPTQCVVGGDGLSLSIAAASIVAKEVRDRAMRRLAWRYPGYGWAANAGYPTAEHRAALARLGPTPHHRAGFAGVTPRYEARTRAN